MRVAFKNRRRANVDTVFHPSHPHDNHIQLEIHIIKLKAILVYQLNFLVCRSKNSVIIEVSNAFVTVNAHTAKVVDVSEDLVSFQMSGDGGNINVGQYRYGVGDLKPLDVTKTRRKCQLKNEYVTVSSAEQQLLYPPYECFKRTYTDKCNPKSPSKDATDTSYSQVNDLIA